MINFFRDFRRFLLLIGHHVRTSPSRRRGTSSDRVGIFAAEMQRDHRRLVGVDAEDEEPLRRGQGLRHQDPRHARRSGDLGWLVLQLRNKFSSDHKRNLTIFWPDTNLTYKAFQEGTLFNSSGLHQPATVLLLPFSFISNNFLKYFSIKWTTQMGMRKRKTYIGNYD